MMWINYEIVNFINLADKLRGNIDLDFLKVARSLLVE